MLFESVAIVAKILPVDDKIPACVKQIISPGCSVKFQGHKHCLLKHFAFSKNVC